MLIHMSGSTQTSPVRRRLPTAERRVQVLEVAQRMFGERGYAGASTADIAREAGISAPALYRHYPNKKALYRAALHASSERMFADWEDTIAAAPNPAAAFMHMGMRYQQMMREEPHLLQIRFRALNSTEDPEIRDLLRQNLSRAERMLSKLAERAQADGRLAPGITPAMLVASFLAWGTLTDVTHSLGLLERDGVYETGLRDAMLHFAAAAGASSGGTQRRERSHAG